MAPSINRSRFPMTALAILACLAVSSPAAGKGGGKRKNIPIVAPESKKDTAAQSPTSTTFAELNFSKTLIIEGKVEKPQVQFTLLKEPPPEKEIRFETSFLQNILKLDRENTFKVGETYGRE